MLQRSTALLHLTIPSLDLGQSTWRRWEGVTTVYIQTMHHEDRNTTMAIQQRSPRLNWWETSRESITNMLATCPAWRKLSSCPRASGGKKAVATTPRWAPHIAATAHCVCRPASLLQYLARTVSRLSGRRLCIAILHLEILVTVHVEILIVSALHPLIVLHQIV